MIKFKEKYISREQRIYLYCKFKFYTKCIKMYTKFCTIWVPEKHIFFAILKDIDLSVTYLVIINIVKNICFSLMYGM